MPNKETYLGDGLYASSDGMHLILRADDKVVYLEGSVFQQFLEYAERTWDLEISVKRKARCED